MVKYSSTTLLEKVRLAKSYVELYESSDSGLWVALGRKAPWPNEDQPPLPAVSIKRVPEAFAFLYVHTCLSVYEDSEGSIETESGTYSWIQADDLSSLASAKANKVYLEASLNANSNLAPFSYRIMGLCNELKAKTTLTGLGPGFTLLEEDVEDYYTSWVQMSSPISVSKKSSHVIQIIKEF